MKKFQYSDEQMFDSYDRLCQLRGENESDIRFLISKCKKEATVSIEGQDKAYVPNKSGRHWMRNGKYAFHSRIFLPQIH